MHAGIGIHQRQGRFARQGVVGYREPRNGIVVVIEYGSRVARIPGLP